MVIVLGMVIGLHLIRSHSSKRCTLDACAEGYGTVSEIAWVVVGVVGVVGVEGRHVYE